MVWEFRLLQQEGLEKDNKTAETAKKKLRLWRGKAKLCFSFNFFPILFKIQHIEVKYQYQKYQFLIKNLI